MSLRAFIRLGLVVGLVAAGSPAANHSLAAQTSSRIIPTSVVVNPVSKFVSATAFTRMSLTDNTTGITWLYFITTLTTQTNMPYQIQASLGAAYAYSPMQARLWDGTGTYANITTTTSQVVAKGTPRSPQTDQVRFRVQVPKGMTSSQLPNPSFVYVIAPQ
jgi:hypothetical protein